MKKVISINLVFILFLFASVIKGGEVILVNRCKDEKLIIVKLKDKKDIKDQRYMLSSFNSIEIEKDKIKEFKVKTILKHGAMVLNVDFKNGEDVWVKGNSWQILPEKWHYNSLEIEKEAHSIVFINSSKKGIFYGGKLEYVVKSLTTKNLGRLKVIFKEAVPAVEKYMALSDYQLETEITNNIRGLLVVLKQYKSTIKNLENLAKDFEKLDKSLDMLIDRFESFGKKGDTKKEAFVINEKEDAGLIAIVTSIAYNKLKIEWKDYFEKYKNVDLKKFIAIANKKWKKEEKEEFKRNFKQIASRCNWAIGIRKDKLKKKD